MVIVLGENIRKVRKSWGLGQKEFGILFDVKRAVLSSYENNNSKPGILFLVKLQQLSHVNSFDLIYTDVNPSIITTSPDYDNKVSVSQLPEQSQKSLHDRVEELEEQIQLIQDFLKK